MPMPPLPDPEASAAAAGYRAEGRLLDGTTVALRAIRPDDKERLGLHFHSLSPDSVVQRFFEPKRDLTSGDLRFYTELDFDRHFALVATRREPPEGAEEILGVGRAIETGAGAGGDAVDRRGRPEGGRDRARVAEVAFAVTDAYQGKGIGTLLLGHLAHLGRSLGYDRFEAWVLPANGRMLDVFLKSGFAVRRTLEDGAIHVRIGLAPDTGAQPTGRSSARTSDP